MADFQRVRGAACLLDLEAVYLPGQAVAIPRAPAVVFLQAREVVCLLDPEEASLLAQGGDFPPVLVEDNRLVPAIIGGEFQNSRGARLVLFSRQHVPDNAG